MYRVMATVKCIFTKKEWQREINFLDGKNVEQQIIDWIELKGNEQHNTELEYVSHFKY